MAETTFSMLQAAKLRWMTGGAADPGDAAFLQGHDDTEAQLRMIALAGVFGQSCLRPEMPEHVTRPSPLPSVGMPFLPNRLRADFRQMMQVQDRTVWQGLLGLMASRGYLAHPFDWMPPRDLSGYPDAYLPLAKWKAGMDQDTPSLTADSWEDMYPADRRAAFAALRVADPAAARTLMNDHGANLPAEERLMLVAAFATHLGDDDIPYLETLCATDRSAKVKAKALSLLARLGVIVDNADAAELAGFIDKSSSGLLRRKLSFGLRKTLNDTQKKRAFSLFETVTFPELAAALNLSEADLAETYVTEPRQLTAPFFEMCVRSAPPDALATYWGRLRKDGVAQFAMLAELGDRFTQSEMVREAKLLIEMRRLTDLRDLIAVTGADAGPEMSDLLLRAAYYRDKRDAVKAALAKRAKGEGDFKTNQTMTQFEALVMQLAILVTARHAQSIIADVEGLGFHPADPVLRPLKFNIALEGSDP